MGLFDIVSSPIISSLFKIENLVRSEKFENKDNNICYKKDDELILLALISMINLGISIYAGYIAWQCFAKSEHTWRMARTIIAFLYGWLYILFHFIFMTPFCGIKY